MSGKLLLRLRLAALTGAVLLSGSVPAAAAGTDGLPTYTVATEGSFPPYEYYNQQGELVGFDIDLIRAIGREMGFAVTFVDIPFTEVLPALDDGRAEIAVAAISITPERMAKYAFSDSYHGGAQRLIIKPELVNAVHSIGDVVDEPVCVQEGSTGHEMLKALRHHHIVTCADNRDCDVMFNDGRCRGMIRSAGAAHYSIRTGALTDAVLMPLDITHNEIGIAVSQQSTALLERIDAGLDRLLIDGTIERLEERWFPSGEGE